MRTTWNREEAELGFTDIEYEMRVVCLDRQDAVGKGSIVEGRSIAVNNSNADREDFEFLMRKNDEAPSS